MEGFFIHNVGVDAGLIMICDKNYYNEWGNKTNYAKNEYGVICSQKIKVEPGTYKVKWYIENTWKGAISGEGIVKTESGIITISDPCYCIESWDCWLTEHNMGKSVEDDVILIDKMGGDGCYDVNLKLTKVSQINEDGDCKPALLSNIMFLALKIKSDINNEKKVKIALKKIKENVDLWLIQS